MKIIDRYILKEHAAPFVFALSALTSLLFLQVIARRFGDLVGRGLSWQIITEFFILSLPYTVALTFPMAVLVAVLYAFSRLASENEVTALKAGGVSMRGLMVPALIASVFLALFMLWFNDQVLPASNHRLAVLQSDIARTKPTFALRPQVMNVVKESQLYLRAGQIDQATGQMTDITIYDVNNADQRRTITAERGTLALAPNRKDLTLRLYKGMILTMPNGKPQLTRVYYDEERQKIRDVANSFKSTDADTASKGEREMTICEMQHKYDVATVILERARQDSLEANWRIQADSGRHLPPPRPQKHVAPGGLGAVYCTLLTKYLHVPELQAAEVPPTPQQTPEQIRARAPFGRQPAAPPPPPTRGRTGIAGTKTGDSSTSAAAPPSGEQPMKSIMDMTDAHIRLDDARHDRARAAVEIEKKFSLAASCIVFVLVGAPLALRFPRGGIGMVLGASFFIFAIYYVTLSGLEPLANKGIVTPIWAMWGANALFFCVGMILLARMGHEGVTSRGGAFGEVIYNTRAWFTRKARGGT